MLKFQCICQIDKMLQFEINNHFEQNDAIWVKMAKILKFKDKIGNRSTLAKCQINQNVAIWVKSMNQLKGWNLRTKLRIDGNVEILLHMSNR